MKMLTVRLPESLAAAIEAESRLRNISKSDIVRERLQRTFPGESDSPASALADLIGSVKDLPADLSARKTGYLRATGYGCKGFGSRVLRWLSACRKGSFRCPTAPSFKKSGSDPDFR